jgi:putative endonuclease
MGKTQEIGAEGENAATEWLESEGFAVVARNWRSGKYELDIVATRFDVIHFIEVKTRAGESWETPEASMTAEKQRAFRRAVQLWLAQNPTEFEPQMDLIAIDTAADGAPAIRYIPTAVICRW